MTVLVKPDIYAAIDRGDFGVALPDSRSADGWRWVGAQDLKIGPNSVDLHLHPELKVYKGQPGATSVTSAPPVLDARADNPTRKLTIPEGGRVLQPGTLYLARTVERTKTLAHVPELGGRSSTARLGIDIHCTAGKGDVGFNGTWTMEISVIHPVRVYPLMRIAQLWLHKTSSKLSKAEQYGGAHGGRYQGQVEATAYRGHHTAPLDKPDDNDDNDDNK